MVVNIKIMYYKMLNSCILSVYIYIILRYTFIVWVAALIVLAILFLLHYYPPIK